MLILETQAGNRDVAIKLTFAVPKSIVDLQSARSWVLPVLPRAGSQSGAYQQVPGRELPPHQPNDSPAQGTHGLKRSLGRFLRKVTPGNRDPKSRLGFIERTKCRLKSKPGVAASTTETFCQIETDATDGPPQLRCKVPVLALNRFNERSRQLNNRERVFDNRGAS